MMNEFLELEFWRVISVRVEEDTPVVVEHQCDRSAKNTTARIKLGTQRCQRMKPPRELDEKEVVAEFLGPHDVVPWRFSIIVILTRGAVPVKSRGANGDDPLPMLLHLVVNGEGNKVGECVPRWHVGTSRRERESMPWSDSGRRWLNRGPKLSSTSRESSGCGNGECRVGHEEDASFYFFKAGTIVFLPRELDMVCTKKMRMSVENRVGGDARAWQGGCVDLQRLGLRILGEEDDE
ncbi:hypothetical protein GOBAR_AA01678 [Gossypium barbadense]|uniref:Uncharacterized protein n=1 Tax=Gossypium barbadense TaxID=3634 RepID=A0A2P5YTN8_GOSBA|nr:hypothetical protein GOBAR_AA01678 [Gossypium barbadense]